MAISLSAINLSKRFNKTWIVKDFSYSFKPGHSYAITGSNGQGKSTLIRLLTGYMPPGSGSLTFEKDGQKLSIDELFMAINIVAPYVQLIEEYTLQEFLDFHTKFKPFIVNYDNVRFLQEVYLEKHRHKEIRNFSSGMKQRLKLGLAFYTEAEILFLDEPTTNMDVEGKQWYLEKISSMDLSEKIVIIASNEHLEYSFCSHTINNFIN